MMQFQIVENWAGRPRSPCPTVVPTSQVMVVLRRCGGDLGLRPQVLRTLEVLLSCLAPKRNHHVVFASNATLVARSGGLSERSIRRHISEMIELGFAERSDSANGKRYSRSDTSTGTTLRFGLCFDMLFARYDTLVALAAEVEARQQRLSYLRCKLRAACQQILRVDPEATVAHVALKMARRNLSPEILERMIDTLPEISETFAAPTKTIDLASTGGQNDRHYSNLSKEHIDKQEANDVAKLLDHCTEAQSFSTEPIVTSEAIEKHAEKLAPMMGISPKLWSSALEQRSRCDLAALIWMMVQNLSKIVSPAAYFHAVTVGKKADRFAPWAWLRRQAG